MTIETQIQNAIDEIAALTSLAMIAFESGDEKEAAELEDAILDAQGDLDALFLQEELGREADEERWAAEMGVA